MFGLSWYDSLNVLGLLILWGFYWIGHKLDGTGVPGRMLNHLTIVVAGFFVVVDPQIAPAAPNSYVVLVLAVFLFGATAWELGAAAWIVAAERLSKRAPAETVPAAASAALPQPPSEDGVLDLDAGTPCSAESRARTEKAIGDLMGPKSSGADRLRGLGVLLNMGEEEDPNESLLCGLIGIALAGLVLLPPCWSALQMI